MEQLQNLDLSPASAFGAALLRFVLAVFWIAHLWFKVGYRGMPATEAFFLQQGLPAWLAWFDIYFEVVIAVCLILGIYVSFLCVISLPILRASMWIYRKNGFYFCWRWHRASGLLGLRTRRGHRPRARRRIAGKETRSESVHR
jgi:uncharacterized membrane protein YphA (DoxX/SURF4 family)